MRRKLSKMFYAVGLKRLSRWCDKTMFIALCMGDIGQALENFARACEKAVETWEKMVGDGGQDEENTTAQEEE